MYGVVLKVLPATRAHLLPEVSGLIVIDAKLSRFRFWLRAGILDRRVRWRPRFVRACFTTGDVARLLLAALTAIALCAVAPTGSARAATVAPMPRLHWTTSQISYRGHKVLVLKSIEVYGIPGFEHEVSCAGCVRIRGPIETSHPVPGATLYKGVNWILGKSATVSVAVYRKAEFGRYVLLGASIGAKTRLVFKGGGCLGSLTKKVSCPKDTILPKPGGTVPTSPATTVYLVTVSTVGSGSGVVTGSGVSCPSTCSQSYSAGTVVTLTAVPTSGSTFVGWSGACSGTGSCRVTMNSAQNVAATFAPMDYTLTVTSSGAGGSSGTVSDGGISCPTTCFQTYAAGTTIVLTATPTSGSTFAGWSGACSGTGSCTVTVNADESVTAEFVPLLPYSCPSTSTIVSKVLGDNEVYSVEFTAAADELITGGYVDLTAVGGQPASQVQIGVDTNPANPEAQLVTLGQVTVTVSGAGGVDFEFPTPIQVTAGEVLFFGFVNGSTQLTANYEGSGGTAGCLIADLTGAG